MKGLSGAQLDNEANYLLNKLQLIDYVKTKAGSLSGGNKRKLGVCNAIIGGPEILVTF